MRAMGPAAASRKQEPRTRPEPGHKNGSRPTPFRCLRAGALTLVHTRVGARTYSYIGAHSRERYGRTWGIPPCAILRIAAHIHLHLASCPEADLSLYADIINQTKP